MRNWKIRGLLLAMLVSLFGLGFFLGQSQARAQQQEGPPYVKTLPKEWGSLKAVAGNPKGDDTLYFEDSSGTIRAYSGRLYPGKEPFSPKESLMVYRRE